MKLLLTLALPALLAACGASNTSTSKPQSGFGVDNGAGTLKTLTIEIRKGIVVRGEWATISTTTGTELDSMKCAFSVAVDFDRWSCKDADYDLEVGKVVVMKNLTGTLTTGENEFSVSCAPVAPHVNGVDGPVLEYTCTAKQQ